MSCTHRYKIFSSIHRSVCKGQMEPDNFIVATSESEKQQAQTDIQAIFNKL